MSDFVINLSPTRYVDIVLPKTDGDQCVIRVTLFKAIRDFRAIDDGERKSGQFWQTVAATIKSWSDCDCCEVSEQQATETWDGVVAIDQQVRDELKKKVPTLAPSPTGTKASTRGAGAKKKPKRG